MVGDFQDTKAAEKLKAYLQSFCEGYYAGIADVVPSKVELCDGGVVLSETERKSMVSVPNWGQNACRYRVTGHSFFVPLPGEPCPVHMPPHRRLHY